MNTFAGLKHILVALLVLGIAVGCAGPTTKDETQGAESAIQAAGQAISDAKAANAEAKAEGAAWRDTDTLIKQAEEALTAGDTAKAIKLANQARRQAENALAQKRAEDERLAAQMAMDNSADETYTVMSGDSLWSISAGSYGYSNPYEWPLIYKANRDQIKDADLIYPGQVFSIRQDASSAEIDAAVQHARMRGAWSLGNVEQSDLDYLAR